MLSFIYRHQKSATEGWVLCLRHSRVCDVRGKNWKIGYCEQIRYIANKYDEQPLEVLYVHAYFLRSWPDCNSTVWCLFFKNHFNRGTLIHFFSNLWWIDYISPHVSIHFSTQFSIYISPLKVCILQRFTDISPHCSLNKYSNLIIEILLKWNSSGEMWRNVPTCPLSVK